MNKEEFFLFFAILTEFFFLTQLISKHFDFLVFVYNQMYIICFLWNVESQGCGVGGKKSDSNSDSL